MTTRFLHLPRTGRDGGGSLLINVDEITHATPSRQHGCCWVHLRGKPEVAEVVLSVEELFVQIAAGQTP